MEKVTVPVSTEDVVKGLAELPPDELDQVIDDLQKLAAARRIKPKFVDVKRLAPLVGIISVGGDAVEDTENVYD